ncbi:MAG: helix-turn-helix domain-containing protein [Candidatus Thermoplasmatota archaeon]|nr:helix-turn-helix domain-containing protein [Candidatus Thermoplasmatota archaeon]
MGSFRTPISVTIFIIIIMGPLVILLAPGASAAVAKVTISMNSPTSKVAEMGYGEKTEVDFTGKLTTAVGNNGIVITLETVATVPEYVSVEFRPSVITVSEPGTQTSVFSVLVTVGHEIEGGTPFAIGIRGKWHSEGSTTLFNTNTEHVELNPTIYYGIEVTPRTLIKSGPRGDSLIFPVAVESLSNTDFDYSVGLDHLTYDAYGAMHLLEHASHPDGLISILQQRSTLPRLSTDTVELTVDGDKYRDEWSVLEIVLNLSIMGTDIIEHFSLHSQSVGSNFVLFVPGTSFLVAQVASFGIMDLEDMTLPESWNPGSNWVIEHSMGSPGDGRSYSLTLGVLLIGAEKELTLESEIPNGFVFTLEPNSLELGHLELGFFNITITRDATSGGGMSGSNELVTIIPTAPDSHSTKVFVVVPPLAKVEPDGLSNLELGAIAGGIFILTILGLGKMELSRYHLYWLFFIPLYTYIHEENALDHFTRGRIYQYIKDNPGAYYSKIKKELGLNNGVVSYHLQTLKRVELIKSRRSGIRKMFFITGSPLPKEISAKLNFMETSIRSLVSENPGITHKEIGANFPDKSSRTISHYVKKLSRKDYIYLVKEGKYSRCYPKEKPIPSG